MNKSTVKIFIASSHTASVLAQKLADSLDKYESALFKPEPVRWWETQEGTYILSKLLKHTKECDFCAILLTESDIVGAGSQDRVRDNCIYEAGLFAGALGDPSRCFLLVSCDPRKLPSDLGGLIFVPLERESDVTRAAAAICQAIDNFAQERQLRAVRGLKLPTITWEDLVCKEKPEEEGGILRKGSMNIFVGLDVIEGSESYSSRVRQNLDAGIEYYYVFEASERNLKKTAKLVTSLARGANFEEVLANIMLIRDNLEICFVAEGSGLGFQYNIYNASDYDSAVCFMRSPGFGPKWADEWIEWTHGFRAAEMGEAINLIRVEDGQNKVFGSTGSYSIIQDSASALCFYVKRELEKVISFELDTQDWRKIEEACFGTEAAP